MNSNYYYNNTSLSEILHTTSSSSSYYGNMSLEDANINPLSAAFTFGYTLPTSSFPYSVDNSYREATYTDYYSNQSVTAPSWATHFSAILIGQGGAGGGGGGGYFMIQDGPKPYYSGAYGKDGTAGTARVLENIAFDNSINLEISVSSTNYTDNKGTTGARNRNVSNVGGTSGNSGQNGSSTTLTYNTSPTLSIGSWAAGGTGGAGGHHAGYGWSPFANLNFNDYWYPNSINPNNPPTTSFTPINGNNYTSINVDMYVGSGGVGGNGGYGSAGAEYGNPSTIGLPQNGSGSYGLCRIYWKGS